MKQKEEKKKEVTVPASEKGRSERCFFFSFLSPLSFFPFFLFFSSSYDKSNADKNNDELRTRRG